MVKVKIKIYLKDHNLKKFEFYIILSLKIYNIHYSNSSFLGVFYWVIKVLSR